MKRILKAMICACLAVTVIGCTSSALTYQGHTQGRDGLNIFSTTNFSPGYKTRSACDSKLKDGKWLSRCWSSVTEGDVTVKKYSKELTSAQAKSKDTPFQEATAKKKNNPLKKQSYNYGWKYL